MPEPAQPNLHNPGIRVEEEDIHDLGKIIVLMMDDLQLEEASKYYSLKVSKTPAMTVPLESVKRVLANHWRSSIRMPAGGVNSGKGSMQTGFEVELITAATIQDLFRSWPNYEHVKMGHSWEARTMEECESVCDFHEPPAGWGFGNAKTAPIASGAKESTAVLMVAPPITVVWQLRADTTTMLTVRAPLVIYTEDDATILPPDDKEGNPFYVDPPESPGRHRDLFRQHGLKMAKKLLDSGYPLSDKFERLVDKFERLVDSELGAG